MGEIQRRLGRLEQRRPPPTQPHLYPVCADEQGRILDDRSELPDPVSVVVGVDPLVILGYKELSDE
jgi:hypothetical protein